MEMAESVAPMLAHIEAQRLKEEAERNTPEGRKKAAEMRLAEIERKKNNWLSRAIHDRGNGWKPIWGTAEDEEMRIYTIVDSGEHRFWGVKPTGMTIDDFWEKYDPEVKRYEDRQQETPVNPDAPAGPLIGEPPRSPITKRAAAKPTKRTKTVELKSNHRVAKSKPQPRKSNQSTRKSLARRLDAGHQEVEIQSREVPTIEDQIRVVDRAVRTNGRPTRSKAAVPASGAGQKTAKAKPSVKDNTPTQSKRTRGRPPAGAKPTKRRSDQMDAPVVQGKARITKSSRKDPRPPAPSTHQMRTRRGGPAEPLELP